MTLSRLYYVWKRPVHLITPVDGNDVLFSHDGKNISHQVISVHNDEEDILPGSI
jgi:hypothetical protein